MESHNENCFCSECRGPTVRCNHNIVCPKCFVHHGDCDFLMDMRHRQEYGVGAPQSAQSAENGEVKRMAKQMPKPSGRSNGSYNGGSLPEPEGGTGQGNPFFKASMLKKGKNKLQFLGKVRDAGPNSFSDLQAEVKFNGKVFDLGIKLSSGNYRRLYEQFGANPNKWKGIVLAEKGEYLGKEYVKIVD